MAVTYYLLLQDRVEEALAFFRRVNPDRLATRLQYDYFTAYLDFYTDDPQLAGPIAERYADYPVDRWRECIRRRSAAQLDEIRGEQAAVVDRGGSRPVANRLWPPPSRHSTSRSKRRRLRINYQNLSASAA